LIIENGLFFKNYPFALRASSSNRFGRSLGAILMDKKWLKILSVERNQLRI
jgi:hypothetical protein